MKTRLLIFLPMLVLLAGCAAEFEGKKRRVAFGLPKPPTNAVIAVTFTKVGIVAEQNPATQSPGLTIGFVRGAYYRVPVGSNVTSVPVFSGVTTERTGLDTTIRETFSVGITNSIRP